MKRVTAFFAFLLAAVVTASGQIMDPVSWSGTARQTAPGEILTQRTGRHRVSVAHIFARIARRRSYAYGIRI